MCLWDLTLVITDMIALLKVQLKNSLLWEAGCIYRDLSQCLLGPDSPAGEVLSI